MDEESLEVYITEDGDMMLYPAVPLIQEMAEEIGRFKFDFTPFCG
jgi:hypothetical protein